MKTAVLVLYLAVAVSASPQFSPFSQATGNADANFIAGSSSGPFQTTSIRQLSASAGGTARGNAISNNFASAQNFGSSGIFGSTDLSNTQAISNQRTSGGGFRPFRRVSRPLRRRLNRNRFF